MDPLTGKILMLCNACSITFDRPRKPRKIVPVPTAEEIEKCLEGAKTFAKQLAEKMNTPEAERLFCPVVRPKTCGCLQKYIIADGNSEESDTRVKALTELLMKAKELSAEKCYTKDNESKRKHTGSKNQGIGIGNGQKRSKTFEAFVLVQREYLKNEKKLCERAVQKVLMYSNNFLHKKLVTEKSLCRAKPVNGLARKGLLQPFEQISQTRCCVDNCVMMAITHKKLLQDWRSRSNKGQSEHRRVIAEMLTPSAGARTNCYTFITSVTGASRSTIVQVSHQMKQTGGEREPPTHGMKKFWQSNRRKTTETVSQVKVCSHFGKTSSSTTLTNSIAATVSKQNVTTTSNTSTTTSNIIIPVSVNVATSSGSNLTVQRQQLLQIQQQMFEQQVQQQQQQHLLQQQLLQHTILQQNGQATDGMPQNLPMLQTMIDQLNVQIQNTQQQLQLSLRTMNMIGSQTVNTTGVSGTAQNMLPIAEHIIEPATRGSIGVLCNSIDVTPTTQPNLIQICGNVEAQAQQHTNVMVPGNVNTHFQTSDQGGLSQPTNQILPTISPQEQQFLNQLSPSHIQGQSHNRINNSNNYHNNQISVQSNGPTIIQVQQASSVPSSHQTQYVQTFLPSSQMNKGRVSSNDNVPLEQFVIQTYPSMNPCIQENAARSSQNSVLVQQLNTPVNQGPRLAGPPLVFVNQQQVDCSDIPSASQLNRELYDIPENGYQQQTTRIDTDHGILHTPILDFNQNAIPSFVSVPGQVVTESTLGTVNVIGQTNTEHSLGAVNIVGRTATENTLGTVSIVSHTATENSLGAVNVVDRTATENTLGTVNVVGRTATENTLGTVNVAGHITTDSAQGTVTENTLGTVNVASRTVTENSLETVNVVGHTTTDSAHGTVNVIRHILTDNWEPTTVSENSTVVKNIAVTSTEATFESVNAQKSKDSAFASTLMTNRNATDKAPIQTTGASKHTPELAKETDPANKRKTALDGQAATENVSMNLTGNGPRSSGVTLVNVHPVVSSTLASSILAAANKAFPDKTTHSMDCASLSLPSIMANTLSRSESGFHHTSQTSTCDQPAVNMLHASPKSAFHAPHKLSAVTCRYNTVCTTSTAKDIQVNTTNTQNSVKMTDSVSGNLLQHMALDIQHNMHTSNVSVPAFSTSKPRCKIDRRNQTTKVTQSRFPTSSVNIVPSTPIKPGTYLSVPVMKGMQIGKTNLAIRQRAALPISTTQQYQHCQSLVQSGEPKTQASALATQQENASIDIASHKSEDRAKSIPLSSCSSESQDNGIGLSEEAATSQILQDSMHNSSPQAVTSFPSANPHDKVVVSYPTKLMAKPSTHLMIGSNAESLRPLPVTVATAVMAVSDTSHQEFLIASAPQHQSKVNFSQHHAKETHISRNSHQQTPSKPRDSNSSSSTGRHENPVSGNVLPINCTLFINPSQNQRAVVGTGQSQPIVGQIHPIPPSANCATTHTRPQLVVDPKNSADQRTHSATTVPLVPNTFTIDSDTLMRLCQQASLIRTVSVDMNTQDSKNI
ncbi:serine-rich adhesin for platelets-like [Argopecten irradians]|uniref:serine-rich adhesin for platelets-like n=1 Tax=Argopecten irradians TaxID=31199 RepID=UPI003711B663